MGFGLPSLSSLFSVPGANAASAPSPVVKSDSPPPELDLSRVIAQITAANWNSVLPYFFAIVQPDDDGKVTSFDLDASVLDQIKILSSNIFPLRIHPSAINVATQYAINVTATNGGILEEHNGLIFRTITIAGNTGVLPDKGSRYEKPSKFASIAGSLFPAATAAVGGLFGAISSVVASVAGNGTEAVPADGDKKDFILETSGYSQFWQLYNFFAAYVQAQKDPTVEQELRLVFGSQKDGISYVVTPVSFELKRDTSNAMLYRYNIVLRCWDIVQSSTRVELLPKPDIPTPDNVGVIKSILNTIKAARSTIQSARNVLSGVHSDIDSVFNIYNQAVLFLSDTSGLVTDVRTFGSTLVNNRQALYLNSQRNQTTIAEALHNDVNATQTSRLLATSFKDSSSPSTIPSQASRTAILSAGGATGTALSATTPASAMTKPTSTNTSAQAASATATAISKQAVRAAKRASRNTGASGIAAASAVAIAASKAATAAAAAAATPAPTAPPSVAVTNPNSSSSSASAGTGAVSSAVAQAAFSSSKTTPGGEDKISGGKSVSQTVSTQVDSAILQAFTTGQLLDLPISAFDLPPSLKTILNDQVTTARSTNAGDFRELITTLQEISDNFAISLNALDSNYAKIYGVPTTTSASSTKTATEDDILLAVALQEAKISFTSMLATGEILKEKAPDPFLSANTALPASDKIKSPQGATVVPFERGSTLERMAQRYLGSPKRARDIAILNGLRAPYIDEIGFTQPATSVTGRTFVVSGGSFAMGQVVVIRGTAIASSRRRIVAIDDLGSGKFRITVDGAANLDVYTPSTNPQIFATLPGTIGPGDMVMLPSGTGPDNTVEARSTPLYDQLNHAEKVFGVDILLDAAGRDIAVSANGDVERSYGYDNAVQAIRLALETEQGENEQHQTYGLPVPIGSRQVDFTLEQLSSIVKQRIQSDKRFVSANVNLQKNGSDVEVFVVAQGASGTGTIPLNFQVGRSA